MTFQRDEHKVYASSDQVFNKGDQNYVRIYYSGEPLEANRPPWDGGFNWSKTENGDHWIGADTHQSNRPECNRAHSATDEHGCRRRDPAR